MESMSLLEFLEKFKDEETCHTFLEKKRFGNGVYCPHCGHTHAYQFSDGKTYKCALCRKKFNVKTGTLFAGSKISLKKWFLAIFLLTTNKKGISSIQLAQQLGVTQKTAWFMDHRIREVYKQGRDTLSGTVEIDETYVGGKEKNKHKKDRVGGTQGRSIKTKAPVIGMVQRQGKVIAMHTRDVQRTTIKKLLKDFTSEGNTLIIADEYQAYNGIAHKRVNHSAGEYVIDASHTNTIEGFWSLLKRGILGIYHYVSPKHLQRYVDEFAFRYNDRQNFGLQKLNNYFQGINNTRLKYKRLIDGQA